MKKSLWSMRTIAASSLRSVLFVVFLFSLTTSCRKDTDPRKQDNLADSGTLIPSCDEILSGSSVLELIRTPDDAVNDRINLILYHYAQAVRTVASTPAFLCYMEEAMISDTGRIGVSLYSLAQHNSSFGRAFNIALRNSMNNESFYPKGVEPDINTLISDTTWDANSFLKGKMQYMPYAYDPVIYFVKPLASCDDSKLPTVVIAQDVNGCDDVAGWRGSNEVLVSETEALSTSEAIIFVGPGLGVYQDNLLVGGVNEVILTDDGHHNDNVVISSPGDAQYNFPALDRADIDIDVDLHQIKAGHRYESGAYSDVKGWRMVFNPSVSNTPPLGFWHSDFDPRKIHGSQITNSTTYTADLNAFGMPQSDFNNNRSIFYGTWENDWWASLKTVVNPCSNFSTHDIGVKMKYSHEWYFFGCGVASSIFPSVNSTWEVNSSKCRFILKRTQ